MRKTGCDWRQLFNIPASSILPSNGQPDLVWRHGSTKEKALDFASRACAGGISQGTPCGAVNAPQGMADVVFLTGQP